MPECYAACSVHDRLHPYQCTIKLEVRGCWVGAGGCIAIDACMSDSREPPWLRTMCHMLNLTLADFEKTPRWPNCRNFASAVWHPPAHTPARQCCCCSFDENLDVHSVFLFSHQEKEE